MARKIDVREKINKYVSEMTSLADQVSKDWDRYYYDGVKKGFKDARKGAMEVKRYAAMIRSTMKEVEL